MEMEELTEMEKNTKSINNTKLEEEKFSRISMTLNATKKELRLACTIGLECNNKQPPNLVALEKQSLILAQHMCLSLFGQGSPPH